MDGAKARAHGDLSDDSAAGVGMNAPAFAENAKGRATRQHTERLFTMRRINSNHFACQSLRIVTFIILLSGWSFGSVGSPDITAWKKYSTEQKTQSIVGFIHCYRTALSSKNAFAQTDITATIRMIDAALAESKDEEIGNLIFEALKKAPRATTDKYAEHWDGPYGFNDGMWWRGADDQDRQAYVQGVFWCAETASGKTIGLSEKSVPAAVQKLNDWYLISDEDWKDPRSGKRADDSVLSAMRQAEIISTVHAGVNTKR